MRENEASATIVLSARQQQMFYLCESEATATSKRPAVTEINNSFLPKSKLYLK
ncbi:hypothetical protein [Lysinibacillus sp. NPDC096212]|uniref:hypothetical protein n=1 Tax=Lysinibacillus sp. NPDC096212 TaxID=3364135 RepID=UPI00382D0E75